MHVHLFGIPWDELVIAAYCMMQCSPLHYLSEMYRGWKSSIR